ncbi:MAG: glycerophosphodiester phosphodiesterase family protein [Myxococcota bacterium]
MTGSRSAALVGALAAAVGIGACTSTHVARAPLPVPLVIGHRGAPGHLPEHTLASYRLAIELGADCIEPDLVATRDGALVARHEPNLEGSTDVAARPEFADRYRAAHPVDGVPQAGWFASDFTLAELRTLRARQAFPEHRFTGADGRLGVPTLEEVIELARTASAEVGRTICLYPELKHPSYHRELGLPLERAVVEVLGRHGFRTRDAAVFLQSFEPTSLVRLDRLTGLRLVQLVAGGGVTADGSVTVTPPYDRPYDWVRSGRADTYAHLVSPAGLDEVAGYADGIGVWKPYLLRAGPDGAPRSTGLVEAARARGLVVHAWTFRSEARWLPPGVGAPADEIRLFYEAGVDGVFADFPGAAVAARTQFRLGR